MDRFQENEQVTLPYRAGKAGNKQTNSGITLEICKNVTFSKRLNHLNQYLIIANASKLYVQIY
jgi:hypothetical protein